jgi:tetratricopeptide (TPR) repeat protein
VLVTSRASLPELVESQVLDLDVLSRTEARTLFALVAGQERALAEPEATDDVLAACAGLPLAIRIGGARLAARGSWTVRTLADRLADERKRLDVLRAGNLAVRASFEVSFASLPGPETLGGVDPGRAFRLLGLWTGSSVSLPAAAALLGEPEDAVADALDVLVDAHLLELRAPDRYRFHDLLRVYAAERARTQETEQACEAAVIRVLAWYLHTTEAAARVISPQHSRVPLEPPPDTVEPLGFISLEQALDWCEKERAGLTAATRLAAASGLHETAWKLPAAAMSFYFRRAHWGDWVTTHQIGLASARAMGDQWAEAWMLNNLGMAYGRQQMPEAIECFEQALAIYRDLGDVRGESRAATNVANAYFDLGRFEDALEAAQRSLEIQRRAGKRYGEGIALGVIGGACRELGRFSEAIEYLREALAIFRELDDRMTEADALSDLGQAYLGLNQVEDAVGSLSQSLIIWQDIGDRYGQAATLQRLARAQELVGEQKKAHDSLEQALRLFEELGDDAHAAEIRRHLRQIG